MPGISAFWPPHDRRYLQLCLSITNMHIPKSRADANRHNMRLMPMIQRDELLLPIRENRDVLGNVIRRERDLIFRQKAGS